MAFHFADVVLCKLWALFVSFATLREIHFVKRKILSTFVSLNQNLKTRNRNKELEI
jgi:hypothetical protein